MRRSISWLCGIAASFGLLMPLASALHAQDRVALVIGNDRYPNLPADKQLAKAVNDARAVGDALQKIGFSVIRGENLNRTEMVDRVFSFTQKIKPGDVAVVFFAGHGVALSGGNYLLPTDIPLPRQGEEARARNLAIGEADIIADIQERKARVTVLLLDACRDNPFQQPGLTRTIGSEKGLARGREAEGVFSVYSAGFGQSALDRLGPNDRAANSVFTRVLVPQLARTDVHLGDIIIDVREEVARLAATINHQQYPAYYDQTRGGRVYLAARSIAVEPARPAPIFAPQPTAPPPEQAAPAAPPRLNAPRQTAPASAPPPQAAPASPASNAPPPLPQAAPAANAPPSIPNVAALPPASRPGAGAPAAGLSLRESWKTKVDSVTYASAISPDGRSVAAGYNAIHILNAENGKVARKLEGHSDVIKGLAFSPDGKALASAGDNKTIKIWDPASGRLIRTIESISPSYNSVAYSPDGREIAAGGGDQALNIWEATGRHIRTITADIVTVRSVAFSPDGRWIATGGAHLNIWDKTTGKLVKKLAGHSGINFSVAFSSDGRRLVSAGGGSGDSTVKIWDVSSGQLLKTLSGHSDDVDYVAIAPDGRSIVSGSSDKSVKVWNAETGQLLQTFSGHTDKIRSVGYSADGRRVVWGDWDGLVSLFAVQ